MTAELSIFLMLDVVILRNASPVDVVADDAPRPGYAASRARTVVREVLRMGAAPTMGRAVYAAKMTISYSA
jgi:hypothetical protein